MNNTKYDWERIKNDVNGNPRYVIHFLDLVPDLNGDELWKEHGINTVSWKYAEAVRRANKIGGRKYNTKSYGGGIVFQSYCLTDTEKHIDRIIREEIEVTA